MLGISKMYSNACFHMVSLIPQVREPSFKPISQREGVNPPPALHTALSACPCLPFCIAPQESEAPPKQCWQKTKVWVLHSPILHFTWNLLLWTFELWTLCWVRTLKKQRNGKSSCNTDAKLSNVERNELRIPGTQRRPLWAHCVQREHLPEHQNCLEHLHLSPRKYQSST